MYNTQELFFFNIHRVKFFLLVLLCPLSFSVSGNNGEGVLLDEIVATVGEQVVLQSDIEQQYLQVQAQEKGRLPDGFRCEIVHEFLMQKLMVHQAELDSVEVSEAQVEMQLDQRLKYFIERIGSEERLEAYFNKTMEDIKQDLRESVYEQLLMQSVQQEIVGGINVSPAEVKRFYEEMPPDSIPYIETQIQYSQLVKYPPFTDDAIASLNNRLLDIRKRVIDGERFSTLAVLYSECASSSKGGELGFMSRGELDPAFAEAAFRLQNPGSVSNIVQSTFGYHLIQLIEKKGNKVNTRHILMNPKASPEQAVKLKQELDSIARLIRNYDSLTFPQAVRLFSEDKDTRSNGGVVVNPATSSVYFHVEEIPRADYQRIRGLKPGEISSAFEGFDTKGRRMYKIVHVDNLVPPHQANLTQDYSQIKQLAEQYKRQDVLLNWLRDKQATTFVKISDRYENCPVLQENWFKQ